MNLRFNKYIVILFLMLFSLSLSAQTKKLRFDHLTTDNGLSNNYVTHIFQDKRGFLWISTRNGLNRYDGQVFKKYEYLPGRLNSLSDNEINHVYEDSKGLFWIATQDGLNILNPYNEKINIFTLDSLISSNEVTATAEDKFGNIWIGTRTGLNLYNRLTKQISVFTNDPSNKNSLSSNIIKAICSDKNGNLWIGTVRGLCKFNYQSNSFLVFLNDTIKPGSVAGNIISYISEDRSGNLWVGTTNGLSKTIINDNNIHFENYYFDDDTEKTKKLNRIRSFDDDSKGNLWIGTMGGGLILFNPTSHKFFHYEFSLNDASSINDNQIFAVCVDNFDNVWIGSSKRGISKFSPSKTRFELFKPETFALKDLPINDITSVYPDKENKLWLGTNGNGVFVYEIDENHYPGNLLFELNNNERGQLSSNYITSILKDKDGNYWIGTLAGGLNRFNPLTKKTEIFKNYFDDLLTISNNYVNTIYEDSEGSIWVGTSAGGVNKFDKTKNSFTRFTYNPDTSTHKSLNSPEVTSIYEDGYSNMWFGTTTGGLNKFNRKLEKFTYYTYSNEDKSGISSRKILCMYEDKKNQLWIGTFGGGLNLFKNNSFIHYGEEDGLSSNIIYAIIEDDSGNLWLTTHKGISRFNLTTREIKNYDESDGLQGRDFNPRASSKHPVSGTIYFGGTRGLNIYNYNLTPENLTPPVVLVTDFKIFNSSVVPGKESTIQESISYAKEINLSHDQAVISFSFVALDFTSPDKNQYAYMLEGFDREWIYSGNIREVTYTNLDPGDYVFHVKATNSDGVWSKKGTQIAITINPPFWATWWAYIFYVIIILAVFLFIRKYEMNRIKLKNDLKQKQFEADKFHEVDQIKSRFFANISHEFRTPLTIILGSLDKLRSKSGNNTGDKEYHLVKNNASRLLQLINQLLELSKIESGNVKLEAAEGDIVKFTKRISASFSSLALQKNLKLTFNGYDVDSSNNSGSILVYFDKKKLETVFYNLLSNAIKFTPKDGLINISVIQNKEYVKLGFENSGIEIPQEKLSKIFDRFYQADDSGTRNFEGTGIGLSLVKEFIELHKGSIEVENKNNLTTFTIYLKLGKNHLNDDEFILNVKEDEKVSTSETNTEIKIPASEIISEQEVKDANKTIILVVEDNADLREMVKEHLQDKYFVLEAENGLVGLKSAEEHIPDLIISDIMMPEMDGYKLCSKIKTNEKTNHIPVILLTAKASTEDKLEGLETGADDYLIKPFNEDELKIRVRNLIAIRRQMREKYQSHMLLKPADVVVPSSQKLFVDKLVSLIEKNINNEEFSVEILSEEIGMSRTQLHRKVKALTNQSASEFIRNFRLQKAAELLKQDAGNIAEISYQVGFGSQAYFTKVFQEAYKTTPLDYKKQKTK